MKKLIVALSLILSANTYAYNETAHEAVFIAMSGAVTGSISTDLTATTKMKRAESKAEKLKQSIIESKADTVEFLDTGIKSERLEEVMGQAREVNPDLRDASDEEVAVMMLEVAL